MTPAEQVRAVIERDENVETFEFHSPIDAEGFADFTVHWWDGDFADGPRWLSQRARGGHVLSFLRRRINAGVPVQGIHYVKLPEETKR